jgi:hypothetical protein
VLAVEVADSEAVLSLGSVTYFGVGGMVSVLCCD